MAARSVELICVALLIGAMVADLRSRRIPNLITLSGIAVALALRSLVGGGAFADGLLGAGLALAVVLPLFAMRGVGGGDAKLMIMAGAFLGPRSLLVALLATALVGGVMSLYAAARRRVLLPVLHNTGDLFRWMFSFGAAGERRTVASPGAVTVPYGAAIAVGTMIALYMGGGL